MVLGEKHILLLIPILKTSCPKIEKLNQLPYVKVPGILKVVNHPYPLLEYLLTYLLPFLTNKPLLPILLFLLLNL